MLYPGLVIEPGSVIAGDLVVREVRAEGGMGTVYVAEQQTMNDCMVNTVTGQTLNGVPSAARGRAVHTFRFLP